jgi:hypothetical protein
MTATIEDISARIEDATREHLAAKRALGTVTIEGGDRKAAEKRVAEAQAAVVALQAAKRELAQTAMEDDERRKRLAQHVEQWEKHHKLRAYVIDARRILELREQLHEAEARVVGIVAEAGARLPAVPDMMARNVAGPDVPLREFHLPEMATEGTTVRTANLTPESARAWEKALDERIEQREKSARDAGATDEHLDESRLPWRPAE